MRPSIKTKGSAGMDISAYLNNHIVIKPQEIIKVPTGFAIALPNGFEAQIRPRSGLAVKYGITVINAPGTIDSDYRGEILIALINHSKKNFTLKNGDRIAQMVIQKVFNANLQITDNLNRGSGGFGHTGITNW